MRRYSGTLKAELASKKMPLPDSSGSFPKLFSKVVEIGDPVSEYLYALDPVNRIVHRSRFAARPTALTSPARESAQVRRTDIVTETLGTRIQDGIASMECDGLEAPGFPEKY